MDRRADGAAFTCHPPIFLTIHLKNIYAEEELVEEGTCKKFLQVQIEGSRKVERARLHYNLAAIISVGYRVNSRREKQAACCY
ncbi:RhuM family protein [Chromohalobacter marismortui]|uniref:RhuM family protein n=1 Tax=Chromohalobacter marismortui TaxID=42055 RepID=UPI001AAECC1B